jgi:hypothetical protein
MPLKSGPNVIKHFTTVIYCHSMVMLPFCVIKQHYLGNYCGMAVNYHGICITNVIKHNLTQNGSIILHHFNPRKSRVKISMVIYRGTFITLAPGYNKRLCFNEQKCVLSTTESLKNEKSLNDIFGFKNLYCFPFQSFPL